MSGGLIQVHGVEDKPTLRRFRELPFVLHHDDERWAPPVRAYDEWLHSRRHPYFRAGDASYFVARRAGAVVGRMVAHVAAVGDASPDGRFGFFDSVDDDAVVDALVGAAAGWLHEQGCTDVTGPFGWSRSEEAGVLAAGFEHAGVTGAPWHPPWYLDQLRRCGFEIVESLPRWEVPTTVGAAPESGEGVPPPVAGRYGDARLVLDGVVGVPDIGRTLVATGLRGAWRTASLARQGVWTRAVITTIDPDDRSAIDRFGRAAAAAGYSTMVVPDGEGPPRSVHAVVSRRL